VPSKDPRFGVVYFLQGVGTDLIKIGITTDPFRRATIMQVQCPVPLKIIGTMPGGVQKEIEIHWRFRHLFSHGEWFRAAPELVDFIASEVTPWVGPSVRLTRLTHRSGGKKILAYAKAMEAYD